MTNVSETTIIVVIVAVVLVAVILVMRRRLRRFGADAGWLGDAEDAPAPDTDRHVRIGKDDDP